MNSDLPPKKVPASERHHPRIRNRRWHYLQQHSSTYFSGSGLAEADPLLYDRLVRQFQSLSERQIVQDKRGWAARMYEDLVRAERRLERVERLRAEELQRANSADHHVAAERVGDDDEEELDFFSGEELNKTTAERQWQRLMTIRFLNGHDTDIDYNNIDYSETWDDYNQITRDCQDQYFDSEQPSWIVDETELTGQTGIQDY
ncbi:coiled-coil domain-containing protein-domain-containing protein [Lipomyces oligophaga]|uniref:coiled-coil domain-containing protein-domain-containing protein n=1 Tax=Lipomyces oligophaga TaxID=45792 RepID=UPI0034CF1344